MDLAFSPTRWSCHLYWQSIPPTQWEEFLRRRKWFEFTLLNYLPLSRRIRGCHGLSDNEGGNHADDDADEDNKEDNNKDNDDGVDNTDSIITWPPSPIVKRNAWNERDAHLDVNNNAANNNDNNIVKRNAREERDAHFDVDEDTDDDEDATITWQSLPLSQYKEFLRHCAWFATNSPDYNGDNNGNNGEIDKDNDDSFIGSLSSVDFNGVDFGPIIEDLQLIRQKRRTRSSIGSYFTIDSTFFFTESDIGFTVQDFPGSFLCQYFEGPWPNFHWECTDEEDTENLYWVYSCTHRCVFELVDNVKCTRCNKFCLCCMFRVSGTITFLLYCHFKSFVHTYQLISSTYFLHLRTRLLKQLKLTKSW